MTGRRFIVSVRAAAFAAVVTLALWPSPSTRLLVAEACSALLSPLLSHTTFEGRTHIHLEPLPPPSSLESREAATAHNITADTALVLKLTKYAGRMQVELSLRRDIYLPLVLFVALIAVSPLSWRRRAALAGLGASVIVAVGIGSVYLLLANIYSGRLPLAPQLSEVYPVSEAWGDVLQFLMERWLVPPANRVIAPLLLGALLLAFHWEELRTGMAAKPSAIAASGEHRERVAS